MENGKEPIGGMIEVDLAHFEKFADSIMAALEEREKAFKRMASDVFDAVLAYPKDFPKLVVTREPVNEAVKIRNPAAMELDKVIADCLNHRTIGYLFELIQTNHESAKQAARAIKRHTENHAMKDQVFKWIAENRHKFTSMDATAEAITKEVPIKFRTARTWVGDWKKLQPTGTP